MSSPFHRAPSEFVPCPGHMVGCGGGMGSDLGPWTVQQPGVLPTLYGLSEIQSVRSDLQCAKLWGFFPLV